MFGPVFRHEMRAAGRRRRYMLLRVVIGALLLAMLAISYESVRQMAAYQSDGQRGGISIAATSQLAAAFYGSYAWFTLFGAVAVTPAIAAGAIASERERRTIEYLFATDLSNSEIVVDKLAARLLTVVGLVLATLPLLAIFRLLGGVPGDLVVLHFANLMTATAMIASISLAVSTWTERARDAVSRAYAWVFLALIAPGILSVLNWKLIGYAPWLVDWTTGPAERWLTLINPFWTLAGAGGAGFTGGVLGVDLDVAGMLWSMAGQLATAAACLGFCAAMVRRVHLAASGRGEKARRKKAARRRPAPPGANPMLWKERFASQTMKGGGLGQRVALGLLVVALAVACLWTLTEALVGVYSGGSRRAPRDYFEFAAVAVGFLGPIVALLAGSRAAGLVTFEKERDTWQSLLTTPLPSAEIVDGKLLGNLWAFRWAVAGVVAIPALGLIVAPTSGFATLGVAVAVAVATWAASSIGVWISLQIKSSVKSIGLTIGLLVGLGGGYLPFLLMFLAIAGLAGDEQFLVMAPCVPFLCVIPIVSQFDSPPAEVIVTYFIGVIGYAVTGFVFAASAKNRFDELCERGAGEWAPLRPEEIARLTAGRRSSR